MFIKAGGGLWRHVEVVDLESGLKLVDVISLDSATGILEFFAAPSLRDPPPDGPELPTRKERRWFRVIDTRNGEEICRTGPGPWSALKGMIG